MDLQFSTSADDDAAQFTDEGYEWSDLVVQLEKEKENQMEDPGPSGERGYEETDLDGAYIGLSFNDSPLDGLRYLRSPFYSTVLRRCSRKRYKCFI